MRTLIPVVVLAALVGLPATAAAYGRLLTDDGCADVAEHTAQIRVEGGIVTTDVVLRLASSPNNVGNNGDNGGNGDNGDPPAATDVTWYLGAAGDTPTVIVDGQPVQVDLLTTADAVQEALQRAEELGDPSLLDISDEPVFRALLGPAPNVVEIHEAHPLVVERGVRQLVHPVRTCRGGGQLSVQTTFVDEAPATVLSPYHALALEQLDGGEVVAHHESWGAQHFDLHLYSAEADDAAGAPVGAGLVSFRDPTCDEEAPGYFALTAGPRPGAADEKPARPKDIVLVVDSSGSMGGDKIEQARGALDHVLTALRPEDRFEVVDFDSRVQSLFGDLRQAGPAAVEDARAFVRRLDAGGGTFIEGGLSEGMGALRNRSADDAGRPAFVVFATDGQATDGVTDRQALIDLATAANLAEARLFPFGIGYDVNAFLLDGLAAANHGLSSFIRPGADIQTAIAAFYEQIRTPVMTNLELGAVGTKPASLVPSDLPDLFDGSQVLVVGTYSAGEPAGLALMGDADGDGRLSAVVPHGGLVEAGTAHGFVPRLWATRRVAQLIDFDRKTPGDEQRVAEIGRLANVYGLVTPWTHFVKDDSGNVSNSYARPDGGESGERAVGHSSDNNDMRGTNNASDYAGGQEIQGLVRHRAERTFAAKDGYWWDTSLSEDADLQDVTFGSDRYRAFVQEAPAARRWLSVGHDVVFRMGCMGVRVTAPDREEVPSETLTNIGDLPTLTPAQAWAEPAEVQSQDPVDWDVVGDAATPGAELEAGADDEDDDGVLKDVGCACGVTGTQAAPGSSLLWLGLMGLAVTGRRRRRRTMRRWPWTVTDSPGCTPNSAPSCSDGRGHC